MLDLSSQRIVVTGGAGFLGRAVMRVLRERGVPEDRIVVPRRRDYDLTIEADVERLYDTARPDVVIHLAAEVGGIGANMAHPGRFFYANMAMGLHLVEQARREFFTALAHEAWHAYADLRLGDRGRLPAWLDEGLAQVFECGLLEAGELRLDAPDPQRLARLADLLDTTREPVLAGLVTAGERQFVVGHGTPTATSRRAYLLAWGVAFDLVLGAPGLSSSALAAAAAGGDDQARFERLVGMPLADYEAAWRIRMRSLARRPHAASRAAAPGAARPLPGSGEAAPAAPDR